MRQGVGRYLSGIALASLAVAGCGAPQQSGSPDPAAEAREGPVVPLYLYLDSRNVTAWADCVISNPQRSSDWVTIANGVGGIVALPDRPGNVPTHVLFVEMDNPTLEYKIDELLPVQGNQGAAGVTVSRRYPGGGTVPSTVPLNAHLFLDGRRCRPSINNGLAIALHLGTAPPTQNNVLPGTIDPKSGVAWGRLKGNSSYALAVP